MGVYFLPGLLCQWSGESWRQPFTSKVPWLSEWAQAVGVPVSSNLFPGCVGRFGPDLI
jgi:hypothetical protein